MLPSRSSLVTFACFSVLAVACASSETSVASDMPSTDPGAEKDPATGFGASTTGPTDGGGTCAAVSAETGKPTIDIIFVIDNSGSMSDEIDQIRTNVNAFARTILQVGFDPHVIFVTRKATSPTDDAIAICVPQPLAGPKCADKLPTFFHVPQFVSSTDSFSRILASYESASPALRWSDKLRFDATKIFIEVTDDKSDMRYDQFDRALVGKAPLGMFGYLKDGVVQSRKYVFHSIVSKPANANIPSAAVCTGASGESVDYQRLSQLTGGIVDEVCKTNYSAVLDNIARNVVSKFSCELTYPKGSDPTKLVVNFTPRGGPSEALTQVTDVSKCTAKPLDQTKTWYYDDNANPSRIVLCPTSCRIANAAPDSKIEALVGCPAPAPR